MVNITQTLDNLTAPGRLVEPAADGGVRCLACAHRCLISPGRRGVCQARFNRGGELRVPWGYVAALQLDPIEKKPFAHMLPGARALTFGMLGCDFHCDFCQNWPTSQTLCNPEIDLGVQTVQAVLPEQMVRHALRSGAQVLVSSYNEPLITTEWAVDIFKLAVPAGLRCAYVSNGYATPEALAELRPYLSAYKVDLKSMQEKNYRGLGGRLQPVLDTIGAAHDLGLWVEVVTLVIPGYNDSTDELWDAAHFIAAVSPDIPWHVTAFHPDYKMLGTPPTPVETLQRAAELGQEAGLHYVYAGNLPGRVGSLEDTFCPKCCASLIKRRGYTILSNRISAQGTCPDCGAAIAGVWG